MIEWSMKGKSFSYNLGPPPPPPETLSIIKVDCLQYIILMYHVVSTQKVIIISVDHKC